jgi:hypothetical protein
VDADARHGQSTDVVVTPGDPGYSISGIDPFRRGGGRSARHAASIEGVDDKMAFDVCVPVVNMRA